MINEMISKLNRSIRLGNSVQFANRVRGLSSRTGVHKRVREITDKSVRVLTRQFADWVRGLGSRTGKANFHNPLKPSNVQTKFRELWNLGSVLKLNTHSNMEHSQRAIFSREHVINLSRQSNFQIGSEEKLW